MSHVRGDDVDRLVAAATACAARPVGSDPLEHALRTAAEAVAELGAALAADAPGARRCAAVDALGSARATTEAVKFAIAGMRHESTPATRAS
jgi:hypothetical protein